MALALLDRLVRLNSDFILNSKNIHKLFFIALIVAIKMNDDETFTQDFYGKVSGISVRELNFLERAFLENLNYKTFVEVKVLKKYVEKLEETF